MPLAGLRATQRHCQVHTPFSPPRPPGHHSQTARPKQVARSRPLSLSPRVRTIFEVLVSHHQAISQKVKAKKTVSYKRCTLRQTLFFFC